MRLFVLWVLLWPAFSLHADEIKLSNSGICHDHNSPSYARTQNFQPFASLEACLKAGGRLPANRAEPTAVNSQSGDYHRSAFRHWSGSCPNTRHQLLAEQSTAVQTTFTNDRGCTVDRGKWRDLYSGLTHYVARELDIDHIVPLAYSWSRGSDRWDDATRERFANDNANLVVTTARLNRQKGALGPTEWLPPDEAYRCQYLLRFDRVMKRYGLSYQPDEALEMAALKQRYCGIEPSSD
ncbi:HNH endonuclease family protein [Ferrimonas marina]|uniref:GmrSD restriction endonucleases C-terminal domain-containing protein n=1 Tax=Ferrimonas marina TaxID=299255 RepID=A0A1M5VDL9_9GAMM|nr:HNH endonuclease family protein [Ferrimonas marina]SHH73372.1 Protein of unknown function [Ferrimonas marina]